MEFIERSLHHSSEQVLLAIKSICYFIDFYCSSLEKDGVDSTLGKIVFDLILISKQMQVNGAS
jgi:hypothetical protein